MLFNCSTVVFNWELIVWGWLLWKHNTQNSHTGLKCFTPIKYMIKLLYIAIQYTLVVINISLSVLWCVSFPKWRQTHKKLAVPYVQYCTTTSSFCTQFRYRSDIIYITNTFFTESWLLSWRFYLTTEMKTWSSWARMNFTTNGFKSTTKAKPCFTKVTITSSCFTRPLPQWPSVLLKETYLAKLISSLARKSQTCLLQGIIHHWRVTNVLIKVAYLLFYNVLFPLLPVEGTLGQLKTLIH